MIKKRIISVFLAFATLISLVACGGGENNGGDSGKEPENPGSDPSEIIEPVYVDTDNILVANKSSEYKIVMPEGYDSTDLKDAASELNYFLKLSTGATLSVVDDSVVSSGDNAKIISVGMTKALDNSGLSKDLDKMKKTGYKIVTKDDDVYLWGPSVNANIFAVYEFLKHEIGFEVYAKDEIAYTSTSTLKLKDFDLLDNPSFTYTVGGNMVVWFSEFNRRLRHTSEGQIKSGPSGQSSHNTTATWGYLPKNVYYAEHPKWYATSDTNGRINLCYNAQGDEDEFELMFDTFMEKFIEVVLERPYVDTFAITQEDICPWCSCPACKADIEKYGAACATQIKFCNKVSDATRAYFKEHNIDRDIYITFFAYQTTIKAPVKSENGKWVPTSPDVVCRDNVYPWYAVMGADGTKSFLESVNSQAKVGIEQWMALSDTIDVWLYNTNFNDYFQPFDVFGSMQDTYKFISGFNPMCLKECGCWNVKNATGWKNLLVYLESKIMWNVNANYDKLVNDFFTNYYKDAAEPMKEAFDLYRAWSRYQLDVIGMPAVNYMDCTDTKYWPKGVLISILNKFDEAYAKIEYLKSTDPKLYTRLYDRICTDSLSYRKYDLMLYESSYPSDKIDSLKQAFKNDCDRLNLENWWEGGQLKELYTMMGITD